MCIPQQASLRARGSYIRAAWGRRHRDSTGQAENEVFFLLGLLLLAAVHWLLSRDENRELTASESREVKPWLVLEAEPVARLLLPQQKPRA